ncbi:MAG: 7-cyano-7-deazaguanine synthase QueC [Porticoccaceae bacterium]
MTETASAAVVLVSGGLDSTTLLAMARAAGHRCYTLSFDYGQRHRAELAAAARISAVFGAVEHKTVVLDLRAIGGSALTDDSIPVPTTGDSAGIPVTYVPARNTIFLAVALGWAEVLGARDLFIGVNAVDYSGYPDCRPEFIRAFEVTANLATRAGVEGRGFSVHTPLIDLSKAEIIARGIELGVDYAMTVSCYLADTAGRACGRCDSCRLRAAGFAAAGIADPTLYQG